METRDQLYQLRKMVSRAIKQKGKIIAVTSGKGGVGKSSVALNLSLALTQLNHRVLLIDADHSLPDLHVLLGVSPAKRLRETLVEGKKIEEVIVQHESGLHMIFSGRSDVKSEMNELALTQTFFDELTQLQSQYEYIIFDTAAGISEPIVNIALKSDDILVVTTPEPAAISDSYALVKVLSGMDRNLYFHSVINWVQSEEQAKEVYERFELVIDHFLKVRSDYWGHMVEDKHVREAAEKQRPFVLEWTKSKASRCVYQIANGIAE